MRRRDVRITGAALFFAASVLGNSFGFVEAVGGQDSENEITQYEGYELVWNDEFDGEYLDDTKWRIGNTKIVRFRVRAYRKAGKVKIYGKYSAVKKVKLKK